MTLTARRLVPMLVSAVLCLGLTATRAQSPEEERLKILTDPESVKKKVEREKTRPPREVFRSQVAPFDVLPFVKANHWSTLGLEVRSNYNDFAGTLETAPVPLIGLPHEIVYRREARLPKAQTSRLGMQVMLPQVPKELALNLVQPESIRPDEVWPASLRVLEPHQMLVVVLTKDPSDVYAPWNRLNALYPHWIDKNDVQAVEKARYYRLVLPMDPDKPALSPHTLTWTTISHVIWDGMAPDTLNTSQQQALLDWLHWGGQLILVGGPGPAFSLLKDSFLSPYLPAETTGENALLTKADLAAMSKAYPPPVARTVRDADDDTAAPYTPQPMKRLNDRYRAPVAISPPPNRPVFLAGLKPKPDSGAVGIPLDDSGKRLVAVERRVGRGRVLMLAFSPTDPSLATWPGMDTFIRRVVLRRPEESAAAREPVPAYSRPAPRYGPLPGPDLSWVRYLSRDMGSPLPRVRPEPTKKKVVDPNNPSAGGEADDAPPEDEPQFKSPDTAVAEWIDNAALPRTCRDVLEEASGIKVPGATFVLKVVLAYILALVPLNWLICRYLLGRRELAWVAVPVLALGFAIGVERAAAYDIGYNTACDEIDILEAYGDYPRAHVTRFESLFTTGRTRYTVSFPDNPTALALPLDNGRSLRGEDITSSVWRSFPVPSLEGFLVQPRSLAMVRAEEMAGLDGAVSLVSEGDKRLVVNGTSLALRDAVVVDVTGSKNRKETYLGTIGPGASVELKEVPRPPPSGTAADALRPQRFLREFRQLYEDRPENQGELRLVAWSPTPMPGQRIEPAVDRHRGFTAFVIHLRNGPPPAPDGPTYNDQSRTPEPNAEAVTPPPIGPPPGVLLGRPVRPGMMQKGPPRRR